ncbi:hypothetical protein BHM03_00062372 [Ensete ventricosum]|nr:hypothetical protein BHM03_00062372 [Ensete ventricosum]
MEDGKSLSAVSNTGAWAMNVVSSVGIIMANKHLLSPNDYAFTFGPYMIPVVCVMEWILHGKQYSKEVKMAVAVVVVGVGVCTVTDVKVNAKGFFCASAAVVFILLSCLLAVFCNISQYLCIGRFSAVSFQVLGHMKTVCVLTLGWLLFDSELTLNNIMGMAIAVIGMVVYSWAVELEKQANKAKFLSKTSLTEEDIRLLKDAVETASAKDVELGETKA